MRNFKTLWKSTVRADETIRCCHHRVRISSDAPLMLMSKNHPLPSMSVSQEHHCWTWRMFSFSPSQCEGRGLPSTLSTSLEDFYLFTIIPWGEKRAVGLCGIRSLTLLGFSISHSPESVWNCQSCALGPLIPWEGMQRGCGFVPWWHGFWYCQNGKKGLFYTTKYPLRKMGFGTNQGPASTSGKSCR